MLNGAQAKNVYWVVNGAASFDTFTEFKGTLVVNNGAINVSTGSIVEGRLLTTNGALTTFSITANMPVGCLSLGVATSNKVNDNIVYPNPFNNTLTLQVNENNINSEFSLFDVLGKLIIQKNINQTSTSIDVNVTPGMYFYKFTNSAGLLQTGKLIAK